MTLTKEEIKRVEIKQELKEIIENACINSVFTTIFLNFILSFIMFLCLLFVKNMNSLSYIINIWSGMILTTIFLPILFNVISYLLNPRRMYLEKKGKE